MTATVGVDTRHRPLRREASAHPEASHFFGLAVLSVGYDQAARRSDRKSTIFAPEDQDALALAMLSLTEGDASAYPIDDATRAAILEGLAEADREDYVPDEVVAAADKRHGI